MRLLARLPAEASWIAAERDRPEVQEVLELDVDASGDIADWWFDALRSNFAKMVRQLSQPAD